MDEKNDDGVKVEHLVLDAGPIIDSAHSIPVRLGHISSDFTSFMMYFMNGHELLIGYRMCFGLKMVKITGERLFFKV